jgi:hypothetical protein
MPPACQHSHDAPDCLLSRLLFANGGGGGTRAGGVGGTGAAAPQIGRLMGKGSGGRGGDLSYDPVGKQLVAGGGGGAGGRGGELLQSCLCTMFVSGMQMHICRRCWGLLDPAGWYAQHCWSLVQLLSVGL